MSLYQEIPKESIMTLLRQQFSPEELDAARLDIQELLLHCNTLDEFTDKVYERIKNKRHLHDFRVLNEGNFIGN